MLKNRVKSVNKRSRSAWAAIYTIGWLLQAAACCNVPAFAAETGAATDAKTPITAQLPLPSINPLSLQKPKAPVAVPWVTLRDAVKDGKIKLNVLGDGVHTSHVRLSLENKTAEELVVFIPANEILHPGAGGIQKMMVVKNNAIHLKPGVATAFDLRTFCASVKSVPPPPAQMVEFSAGSYGDEKTWHMLASIVAASEELARNGAYNKVAIKKDTKEQIAQFAIWRFLGLGSKNPEDQVSPDSIEADLLRAAGEKVKKDPSAMKQLGEGYALNAKGDLVATGERKKKLHDDVINPIFEAIDLTVRKAQDPNLKNVAPLPAVTAWETFINAGDRAYENGEFIEASEVLEAAVNEAEKFGEKDPRLSKSLVSKGRCSMDAGFYDIAETDLNRALSMRERLFGKESIDVAEVDNDLGVLKQRVELYPAAQYFFGNALSIVDGATNAPPKMVLQVLNNTGRNYCFQKDGAKAEPLLKRALALALLKQEGSKEISSANPDVAEVETNLGAAYVLLGRYPEASKLYEKALAIDSAALGDDHPFIATILDGIAETVSQQGNPSGAESYRKRAQEIRDKSLGKFKYIASLPLSYDALTRAQRYAGGAKDMTATMENFKLQGDILKVPSLEKVRINRPIKDKWAVVIGVSNFKDPSINLKFASKDAKDFADFLVKEANFAPDHVHTLLDGQATRANILSEVADTFLPRVADKDDLVVIFISTHGSPSKVDLQGINYLVAHDTDKSKLFGTGIPLTDLTKLIKDRVASERVICVLDACHSGAANAVKGLVRVTNVDAESIAQGSGQLVICSSQPDEVSWESKRYNNGVFTHYLLDAYRNNPKMKLGDVANYLSEKVKEEVRFDRGEKQNPVLKSTWQGDDLILTLPSLEHRQGIPQSQTIGLTEPTETAVNAASKSASKGAKTVVKAPIGKVPAKTPVKAISK